MTDKEKLALYEGLLRRASMMLAIHLRHRHYYGPTLKTITHIDEALAEHGPNTPT